MQDTQNTTTVLCLFHTREHAQQALADLQSSQIPASAISVIGGDSGSTATAGQAFSSLQQLGMPERDVRLLSDGLNAGGAVVVVSGSETYTDTAETIFGKHRASQVDEKVISDTAAATAATQSVPAAVNTSSDGVIPVIEENLVVGKRQVQRGGVRVYSHMVETPVEEKVVLQEEHAVVDRHPVNRAVTEADLRNMRDQSFEVTETAEEAVVEKSARVVEEVMVSKDATERTEHISDTVRRTEVEVEQVDATTGTPAKGKGRKKA